MFLIYHVDIVYILKQIIQVFKFEIIYIMSTWPCFLNRTCSIYFNLSGTYVGVGMISPYLINVSMLVGAIVSWGLLWPFIESKKGSWYDADLQDTSLKGLNGYKVTVAHQLCF
jgi:uncharacterized oligopeptide transporter (OPT) family protein